MGISERRKREKEQRKTEIVDAAERLFFSRNYEDVTMDNIAQAVELNKATIYLYFKNKEALFATIVLRGVQILKGKYQECMEKQVPGIVKVALMGQAYYQFSKENPDYLRLIHFYGSERFSSENPYTSKISKGYGTNRMILQDAIQEGINDGTIRADLDPFQTSMYLMISFIGILSLENKWKLVIESQGLNNEQFCSEFLKLIIPAIVTSEAANKFDEKELKSFGFFLTESIT